MAAPVTGPPLATRSAPEMIPILLVDDQPSNLTVLEAILASSGCQLVSAHSADEALLALLDQDFAAIVLDIRMPGMSGLELARLIKQRKRTRDVPILFLTAYMLDEADVARGYEAGAVDYLTKPITPVVLQSKISVFAELFRKRRELARVNEALEERVAERTAALRHAHAAVAENETRLRLALDAAGMGSWIWELAADQLSWSPSPRPGANAALEGSFADLLTLVHPDDRELLRRTVRAALDAGGDYRAELRFVGPDGSIRWSLAAGRVLTDEHGVAVRMAGIDLDITARKAAESVLREADQRKDEFLAMLAHELRNPLAPITNAVQILQAKGREAPELQWATQVIERQARQMTRLVDDLLDVSRISRGKLELRKERITLDAVIRSAVETSRPLVEASGHRLEIALPAEPVELEGDATRLAQSVMNLLNNSAKYTDRGGTIQLAATRDGDDAVISVRDDGIGIPVEMQDRVFEMFTQLDYTLERSHGGLGVGLALVRTIVTMHGGSVRCRSEGRGLGSEFIIRLPIAERVGRSATPAPAGGRDGIRSRRILVAEDGRDAADSFGLLLTMMGHEVRVVYDGQTAVTAAEEFRPEVVIMDLGMPRLNGYDAARRIRLEPWGAGVMLIALSGWGQVEDRMRSAEAGFNRHLTKPVDHMVIESVLASDGGT